MKTGIVYIIIGAVLGFLIHAVLFKPEPVEVVVEKTIEVPKEVIVERVVARIDTVYIEVPTIIAGSDLIAEGARQTIAVGDTTLDEYGDIHAVYFFPPENHFDFTFYPEPMKVVKILPPKPKWYETRQFGFICGVVSTGVLVYLIK